MSSITPFAFVAAACLGARALDDETPVEFGQLNWGRVLEPALGSKGDATAFLSPRQRTLAQEVNKTLAEVPEAFDDIERPSGEDALAQLDEYRVELLIRV